MPEEAYDEKIFSTQTGEIQVLDAKPVLSYKWRNSLLPALVQITD